MLRATLHLGYERKCFKAVENNRLCSKFQTLKPTGSHSKGLFIDSCPLAQLWSRNVVSTCVFSACQCVYVNAKCCVHVLWAYSGRRVPDVEAEQGRKMLVII